MHLRPRLVRAVSTLRTLPSARSSGQIIVLFAVFVIVLMVLAGSAYDYASIVTDDARLQNAVDSSRQPIPVFSLLGELLFPGARKLVELGLPIVLRASPLGFDQILLLQPVQRRI